ncbi:MAG: hypothetical protein H7Z41_05705 [Cytophagales bacterium]|nr:hypothetical protein [Armatimonadota bacterium]
MSKAPNNLQRSGLAAPILHGAGVLLALAGVSLATPAATAQVLPRFDTTSLSASNITPSRRAFDMVRGQNKNGPYPLTWTNLRITRSDPAVVVNVNGKDLSPGAYSLDAAKGTITFRDSLGGEAYARVEYNYDPDLSKRSTETSATPITLTQARIAGTSLQLMALPSAGGASATADAAKLVWGLGGKTNLLGGGLTSQLYFGDGGVGKTGITDRSGMKLGYAMGSASSGIDAQFQRAGASFAPTTGKALGMSDARQDWSLGTRLKPANWVSTNYKTAENRDLNGKGSSQQNDFGLKLGGVRASEPTFNLSLMDSVKIGADGKAATLSSDKMDFAQRLAPTLALTAKSEIGKLDALDDNKDVDSKETTFALASRNAKGNVTQAAISLTQGEKETRNAEEKRQSLNIQLQPVGNLTLSLAQNDKLALTPIDSSDDKNETNSSDTTMALASKNAKGNITQAALLVTQGTTDGTDSSEKRQSLTLQLQPSGNLTLSLAQNEKTTVSLSGTPEVATDDTTINLSQTVVGANLQLAPNTKLTGSVQQGEQNTGRVAATDLNAQIGVGKSLDVTGGVTSRTADQGGLLALDTTQLRLQMRPSATVSLTGGIVTNPQDKNGVISEARRQDVGLTLKQGAWEVGSGYAITTLIGEAASDERGLAFQTGEMLLSLGLRLSPYSRFSGSYKNSFLYGNTNPEVAIGPRGLLVYSLNYTQNMGEAFSLSLGGTVTNNKAKTDQPQDVKAEAKLGLKF